MIADRVHLEARRLSGGRGWVAVVVALAVLAAACTTVQRIVQPVQPVIIQRNYLLPVIPQTPRYIPPSDIGEA